MLQCPCPTNGRLCSYVDYFDIFVANFKLVSLDFSQYSNWQELFKKLNDFKHCLSLFGLRMLRDSKRLTCPLVREYSGHLPLGFTPSASNREFDQLR